MNTATNAVYQHMLTTDLGRAFYSKSSQDYGHFAAAPATLTTQLYGPADWQRTMERGTRLAYLVRFGIENGLWPAELSNNDLLNQVDFAAVVREMGEAKLAGWPTVVAADGWNVLHNALHPDSADDLLD